jgi:hypothetical protein
LPKGNIFEKENTIIMIKNKDIQTLQLLYAGSLADLVQIICDNGLLEIVSAQKQIENNLAAPARVREFRFTKPADVFKFYSDIIGFVKWESVTNVNGYTFTAKNCKLKDIASYLLIDSPCDLCCITPIKSLCSALKVPYQVEASQTLWESKSCILFAIKKTTNSKNKTNKSKREK